MSNLLWLHPIHFRLLLKYYVPFVITVGLVIFFIAWIIQSGNGLMALSGFLSFVAGVFSGAITSYFLRKRHNIKRDILDRVSNAFPCPT